jgi:hypothetical protein
MRRVDKSMVEVLQMSKETRDQWMRQVKGRDYSTTRMDDYFDVGESQPRAPKEKAATPARAHTKKGIKITTMFKRLRNGEQRDGEMAENEEVVEIETGTSDTTRNQTQVAQRGTARSRPVVGSGNTKGVRTRTPGKQATLSAVGIEVTPVVGPGTANEKEAQNYINKGERARRRTRRENTTGDWVIIERDGAMLHRRVWGKENAGTKNVKVVLVTDGV